MASASIRCEKSGCIVHEYHAEEADIRGIRPDETSEGVCVFERPESAAESEGKCAIISGALDSCSVADASLWAS